MAKQEDADAPKGRLLFTDFAISEKGRPPGLSRPSGATALAKPLPTLRDVISSLDISFEADDDDRDEPDFPSPRDESAPGGAQSDGSGPDDDTADSLFEALEEDESGGDTGPGREGPARPAPLDGFLSTFTPLDEPDTEEIAFAGTPGGDDTDLDPDFDLASLSAPRGSPPSVSTGDAASEPDDAAWLAIVNRMLDNIGPEDDILSLVPSDAGETTSDRAGRKATRIHVPPPRPWPYGGIERVDNWYVPPEEGAAAALSGHPARVDNWY